VVVCIVADGRLKINPRTRSVLAALGVYQDGVAKNVVNGKPVVSPEPREVTCRSSQTAHLYEYTTQCEHHNLFRVISWLTRSGHIERWQDQARRRKKRSNSADLLYERAEPEEGESGDVDEADGRSTVIGGSSSELSAPPLRRC